MKAENVIGPASIVSKPQRPCVGIRFETPFAGMFGQVTPALKRLRQWARVHDLAEAAPYFLRYYHCDMKRTMEVEVGLMTGEAVPGDELVRPGWLPAGRYATLTYRGNGLRGNQALMAWAKAQGVRFDPLVPGEAESYVCRYEAWLTDHRVEPRKLLWDVELSIKVVDD